MQLPTATYRLQLRNGTGFAEAAGMLPYLADLGISHLHLSPIFRAVAGSTHGYDATDPREIEPELGGRAGFSALATEARRHGMGIILDIVPNHTAFSVENPWLREVLRHGRNSAYARHFDIDWDHGKLLLPVLGEPLETMIAAGALWITIGAEGAAISDGDTEVPLAPGPLPPAGLQGDPATLRRVLQAQHWRLTHREDAHAVISHRRFFSITGLIGMRVEDPAVFADTHALILDLVAAGEVQGLRVDHIDGLADPAAYLHRLRDRLPQTPVWVEKILTGDEMLPDWPVAGTTGYEAGRAIARVLTDRPGLARLDQAWRRETGRTGTFAAVLETAKADIMAHDLFAEREQLTRLAAVAMTDAHGPAPDEAALREAVLALLYAFPRYRTYLAGPEGPPEDRALMAQVAHAAAQRMDGNPAVGALAAMIVAPAGEAARRLQTRFQQVTSALLAKAQEDTACFRWNRYLAANEVGADPDAATLSAEAFEASMQVRAEERPHGLTLTSSHDSKRSEDARMRLVAISHLPEAFLTVWREARSVAAAERVEADLAWYIVQSVLAIWHPDRDDLEARMAAHVRKAMREAKLVTTWARPDAAAERGPVRFGLALLEAWRKREPCGVHELLSLADHLSVCQAVLKLTMPGIPDLYQATETGAWHLTDPDNRKPVDAGALQAGARDGPDAAKRAITRIMLRLRRANPALFAAALPRFALAPDGAMHVSRAAADDRIEVTVQRDRVSVRGRAGVVAVDETVPLQTPRPRGCGR